MGRCREGKGSLQSRTRHPPRERPSKEGFCSVGVPGCLALSQPQRASSAGPSPNSPQPRSPSSGKSDTLVIFHHRPHIHCFPVASANSLCKAAFIYRKLQPRRLALK